jgi:hypothetical protein
MGLHCVVSSGFAVWETPCLPHIYGGFYRDHGCDTTLHDKWTLLSNEDLARLLGAPVESLCEISMADIWFAHERPLFLAVYGLSLAASGKLAPVFAAFTNTGQGWKWTLVRRLSSHSFIRLKALTFGQWCAIGMGVAFVYCFFLMEETNYDRRAPQETLSAGSSTEAVVEPNSITEKTESKMLIQSLLRCPRSHILARPTSKSSA